MRNKFLTFLSCLFALLAVFVLFFNFETKKPVTLTELKEQITSDLTSVKEPEFHPLTGDIHADDATAEIARQTPGTYEELLAHLRENDVCELYYPKYERYKQDDRIRALFAVPDYLDSNNEADRTAEYILKNILNQSHVDPEESIDSNDIIEFYRALVYGKLIDPKEGYEKFVDYKKAEQILMNLESKDPDNGAIPLMRAGVLLNQGASDKKVKSLLVKGMRAPNFDTYHVYIMRRLLHRSFTNAGYDIVAHSFPGQRIISFWAIFGSIKNIIKAGDTRFADIAENFAKRLELVKIPQGGRFDFYEWDMLQLGYARSISNAKAKFIDKKPVVPFKGLSVLLTYLDEPEYKDAFQADSGKFNCDKNKIESIVRHNESIYKEFMAGLGTNSPTN